MSTYQDILHSELSERKRTNQKFSLRAFARELEISPGHLSLLIQGKKNLTQKQASKIISKLRLSSQDRSSFLSSAFPDILQTKSQHKTTERLLSDHEFTVISAWYYMAILSLGDIPGNRAEPKWIAKRLGLSEDLSKEALKRLVRLGFIKVYKDGSFKQISDRVATTDDVPSQVIRDFHKQNLELAKSKLDSIPVEQREFGSVTIAVNPSKIHKAKQMIREFQDQVCEELETGKKKSVYTLSVQLFPVSYEERKES